MTVRPIIYHMRAAQHRDLLATRGQGASAWWRTPSTTPGVWKTCGSTGRGRHLRPVPRPMSLDRLIKLYEAHDGAFDG